MSRRAVPFWPAKQIIDLFIEMGCDYKTDNAEICDTDGDCFRLGEIRNPETGGFKVTDAAKTRFSFPAKNEAPSAEAPGPQESVEEADQTGTVEEPEKGKGLYE